MQVFHWLVQDRVDYVETTPDVSRLAHARIVLFMAFLLVRALLPRTSSQTLLCCVLSMAHGPWRSLHGPGHARARTDGA